MKHRIVYRELDAYVSFPHVVRLKSGRLATVFRRAGSFSAIAAITGKTTHHDPNSSVLIVFSDDNGITWSAPVTIYSSHFGVNDPALTVLEDGVLLLRFVVLDIQHTNQVIDLGGRPIFSHRVEHGLVSTVVGNMVCKSDDEGLSWEELGISDPPGIIGGCSRDPILEMPDGSLLMSLYTGSPQRSEIAWVIRSFDRGATWYQPSMIMCDPKGEFSQQQGINFSETSLLHIADGQLLALIRSDETFYTAEDDFVPVGGLGELRSSRSMDGGLSWTRSKKTGIYGTPGALTKLCDGRLLATYGYRRGPYGIRCCFSYDQGVTWDLDNEIVIRDDSPTWDCGYPFSLELSKGCMLTVYYLPDENGFRHIASTHWDLP